jgi:anti-sigma factor RsiW
MTNWTKGHLSELALETWAAREADPHDLEELESHIQACPACRAKATEWRGLFLALASLKDVELSNSFEDKVMEQVRIPSPQVAGVPAWVAKVAQRAPRIAAGVVGAWTLMIVGAAAWLQKTVDVPPAALLAQFLNSAKELLLAGAIEVATFLQLSGFIDWLTEVTGTVPGLGVAGAAALMTALSSLAIWTLYRVTRDEPPRVDAHA